MQHLSERKTARRVCSFILCGSTLFFEASFKRHMEELQFLLFLRCLCFPPLKVAPWCLLRNVQRFLLGHTVAVFLFLLCTESQSWIKGWAMEGKINIKIDRRELKGRYINSHVALKETCLCDLWPIYGSHTGAFSYEHGHTWPQISVTGACLFHSGVWNICCLYACHQDYT